MRPRVELGVRAKELRRKGRLGHVVGNLTTACVKDKAARREGNVPIPLQPSRHDVWPFTLLVNKVNFAAELLSLLNADGNQDSAFARVNPHIEMSGRCELEHELSAPLLVARVFAPD